MDGAANGLYSTTTASTTAMAAAEAGDSDSDFEKDLIDSMAAATVSDSTQKKAEKQAAKNAARQAAKTKADADPPPGYEEGMSIDAPPGPADPIYANMALEFGLTQPQLEKVFNEVEKKVIGDCSAEFDDIREVVKEQNKALYALPNHAQDTVAGMAKLLSTFKEEITSRNIEMPAELVEQMNVLSARYKEVHTGLQQQNALKVKVEKVGCE